MKIRQSLIAQALLTLVASVYSLIVAPSLPSVVPTHWGLNGKPDAYGSPALSLWLMPGVMLFDLATTWGLPKLSPKKFEIRPFERTYGTIMLLVTAFMGVLHIIILSATKGSHIDIGGAMMGAVGGFMAIMGLFIGNVKRNFYMGVRTPWTLASERVWNETHRQAGPIWFYGGLLLAIAGLVGAPMGLLIAGLLLISMWPVLQSYLLYRRYES